MRPRFIQTFCGFGIVALLGATPVWADPTALENRMAKEARWKEAGLFLLPHRPNYALPLSYNGQPNTAPFPAGTDLEKYETKFQISLKVPIIEHLSKLDIAMVGAYTQASYWQTYSNDSSFFRDNDYEPEFFLQSNQAIPMGSWAERFTRLGFAHQSNGESGSLSRSWNRLYLEFVFDHANSMISFKPWYRLTGDAANDTNPDLWKYMGYGELRGAQKLGNHELSLLFRNNLMTHDNKGAVELGWAFPLIRPMKGFIQYFNGYGDCLIDYNAPVSRISAGVSFSDWL
jgi:phospholipase A1